MIARALIAACAIVMLPPASARADRDGRAPTFVSTTWLARHLGDPGLVVLHAASQRADHQAGHVPGARFIGWSSFTTGRDSLTTELPAEARFDSVLEAAGVSDDSRIVITGGPVGVTSRLLVTLDHFGLGDRVSLLDGGIDAWRAEGRPVARDSVAITPGSVTLRRVPDRVVDAAWVAARRAGPGAACAVVDARVPEFYEGFASNNNPRPGRIPGAGNVPFTWLTGELGRFRDARELRRLFARAGVAPGRPLVTYCHIGIQASVAYVAARSIGHDVAMYDGSFEDWSRRTELPVEGPPGR